MPKKENPRKKKLDAISHKIAVFIVEEGLLSGDPTALVLLSNAMVNIDQAVALLVKRDEEQR